MAAMRAQNRFRAGYIVQCNINCAMQHRTLCIDVAAHLGRFLPNFGRPSGAASFLGVRLVYSRATRRCFTGIGPVRGCGRPNAPLVAAACGSYLSHSDSRDSRQRLAGGLMRQFGVEADPVAIIESWTVLVVAAGAVIDPVPVADVEHALGAEPPDRKLNKPRKGGWECGVERASVDPVRESLDDLGAATGRVAPGSIGVLGLEAAQEARPVEEVVHEGVNRDHARAGGDPLLPTWVAAEQEVGERHRQHLVGHAVDVPERLKQGRTHARAAVCRIETGAGIYEPLINPGYKVAVADIPDEQEQAVSGLVQAALPQRVRRQGALGQMLRLGAGAGRLGVSAALEMPGAPQLRARRPPF